MTSPRKRREFWASSGRRLYGYMAEFARPDDVVAAATKTRENGYHRFEAYTPYPLEALTEAVGHHRSRVPLVVLCGGITGFLSGLWLCWWTSAVDFPLNIGGRPLASWVAFIPPVFETTVLFSGISALLGMLVLNGLPMPHHPVFNVPRVRLASRDRYFLMITTKDPLFDQKGTLDFMNGLGAADVVEVED